MKIMRSDLTYAVYLLARFVKELTPGGNNTSIYYVNNIHDIRIHDNHVIQLGSKVFSILNIINNSSNRGSAGLLLGSYNTQIISKRKSAFKVPRLYSGNWVLYTIRLFALSS